MAGINEVLKKGEASALTEKSRVQFEMGRVESFLAELAKNTGMVSYGPGDVQQAAEAGGVEELLVSDELLKDMKKGSGSDATGPGSQLDTTMEAVEKQGGKVHIISSCHDGGKQLKALGGVVALLRYKMGG